VEAKLKIVRDMAQKICRWCGKEYEFTKTSSNEPHMYCSKRCETAAKNENSQHSSSGGGSKKWIWIILIIIIIVGYCSRKKEGKNKD